MNRLKFLTLAQGLAISLSLSTLSGCAVFQGQPVSAETQAQIDTVAVTSCALAEAADTAFNQLNHDPEKAKIEAEVYTGFHEICKPPYTADLATIIKKAMAAYNAIRALTPPVPAPNP